MNERSSKVKCQNSKLEYKIKIKKKEVIKIKNKNLIIAILVLVVGGGAFFAGMKYQESKRSAFLRQFGEGQGIRVGQGNRLGFRPVNGEIISSDEKSITVKLQDESSKIVILSDKTEINKAANATREDLKVGEKVAVFGLENSDGSITANSIQIGSLLGR